MYIKDSNGKPSFTITLSVIAFVVVMLKVIASGASIEVGTFSYSFGTIDSLSIAAILGPILGTYAARRYTGAKYEDAAVVEITDAEAEVNTGGEEPPAGKF